MKANKTVRTLKSIGLSLLMAGAALYAGGCSALPDIGSLGDLLGGLVSGVGA